VGVDTFNVISLTTDPDTVYANGGATMVWVDFIQQKAAPWPLEIKAKFDL
jgi:acyl-CoA thioester hydrolase